MLAAPALTAAVRFLGATLGVLLALGALMASAPPLPPVAATGLGFVRLLWLGAGAGAGWGAVIRGPGAAGAAGPVATGAGSAGLSLGPLRLLGAGVGAAG